MIVWKLGKELESHWAMPFDYLIWLCHAKFFPGQLIPKKGGDLCLLKVRKFTLTEKEAIAPLSSFEGSTFLKGGFEMTLEELKERLSLLRQAHKDALETIEVIEKEIFPLKQKVYKLQERAANIRLEFDILERRRVVLEKPSEEVEKLIKGLMLAYKVDKDIAAELAIQLKERK